jgi:predicted phage tail protein
MDELRTIRLYGVLGARFGREHRLAIRSSAEAIRALSVVIPGFRRFLQQSRDMGLTFAVFVGKDNITKEQLAFPTGRQDIRIAPILQGSKRGGIFQTILGAALVVVGVVFEQPSLIAMGASMALGGVMQMLSPQAGGLASTQNQESESYYFNGAANGSANGACVSVVYGEMLVGSKVGSSGIFSQDQM